MQAENLLLIDIETVPMCSSYDLLNEKMQKLWDRKSLQIDKEQSDTRVTFDERAGIYAEFGKIICIGLGYFVKQGDRYTLKVKSLAGHDEKVLLNDFREMCNKFFRQAEKQFCGHNIREFDIPYICRRAFINQVKLPDVLIDLQNKKPWENPMLDTMQFWKFGEYKHFTSVELLATILDIDSPKDDIDGSQVAEVYWKQHELARIVRYCNKDVITVAQLFMRLNELPLLSPSAIYLVDAEAS
jgi:DNA polymerase elongation subunit (family B)